MCILDMIQISFLVDCRLINILVNNEVSKILKDEIDSETSETIMISDKKL